MPNTEFNAGAEEMESQAFWPIPGTHGKVIYSLPLFQEVEFVVNEGFRKIPHGGLEVGGLLLGSLDAGGPGIKAYRIIECEHAFGPSLMLSERDLKNLESQIVALPSDPELANLQLVGWFLAHTRGPLQMTDPELELFDRFFPLPGQLTVLVKPERFQATQFGFVVRDAQGTVARDASRNAIVLPLPGRGNRASGPAPSLLASHGTAARRPSALPGSAGLPLPGALPDLRAADAPPEGDSKSLEAIRAARRRLKAEEARLLAEQGDLPPIQPPAAAKPVATFEPVRPKPVYTQELPAAPREVVLPVKTTLSQLPVQLPVRPQPSSAARYEYPRLTELAQNTPPPASSRLSVVLPLAALCGSVVGYIAYLQLPSPVIPLNARGLPPNAGGLPPSVLISWPPSETRHARYAAIRVDDNSPVLLSEQEKAAGALELSSTPDMKVELITRNWLHDSRGIVRFVRASGTATGGRSPRE